MTDVIEKTKKYLFRQDAYTYAVLDGAAVPDLPNKLYETQPRHVCLYRGELAPDLVYVAPYLVHLKPAAKFTEWILSECWGNNWGIFVQTPMTIVGMRKHLRSLLTVYTEEGKPLLFRYYDPRVFLTFLPTCNTKELENFFGDVGYYFAETEDTKQLLRYKFEEDKLYKTSLKLEN